MPSHRSESIAFTVVVSVVTAVAAVAIAVVLALSGEPGTLVLAAVLAFVPVGPLVVCYLWLDRYEPEPRSLLAAALAWGAFVATLGALVVQGIGGWFVDAWTDTFALVVGAPFVEEATKGAFLVLLLWWRRHELDGVLDGIVYAGMVGIGFAFTENILYLAAAYAGTDGVNPGGLAEVGALFVMRCLASPFAHPLFTAFIGIGIGLAITLRSTPLRVLAVAGGYLMAVALHAAWNGSTLWAEGVGFLLIYPLVMVPVFGLMVALAIWMRSRERVLLGRALTDAAQRGLIDPRDIRHVVDLASRRQARAFAKLHGGREGWRRMREFQQAAVELGYLHHRVLRGTAPPNHLARGQVFVDRMFVARAQIAFPVTPSGGAHR